MKLTHDLIERNQALLIVLVILTVAVGGLVEIVPLSFMKIASPSRWRASSPTRALQLTGRDIYMREGCYNCHSQMIRPFRAEVERYGHYSTAGEFVYDHPFQWGSKRTGPDLHRVGGRYSDEWHRIHLANPRDVVPESNMPGYPWMAQRAGERRRHRGEDARAAHASGVPYSDEEIKGAQGGTAGQERDGRADRLPAGARHRAEEQGELTMDINTLRIGITLVDLRRLPRHRRLGLPPVAQAASSSSMGRSILEDTREERAMSQFTSGFWDVYIGVITRRLDHRLRACC